MKAERKPSRKTTPLAWPVLCVALFTCSAPVTTVDEPSASAQQLPQAADAAAEEKGATTDAESEEEVTTAPHESGAEYTHPPFEDGECDACHERGDAEDPGKITAGVNELCFECHDDLQEAVTQRKLPHEAAADSCTNCHNPHNSKYAKLLVRKPPRLCAECHDDVVDTAMSSKVGHGAVLGERSCPSCHNPHGSDLAKLLLQRPYELCLGCHGEDGIKDHNGKPLINMKKHLADNPNHHAPVADEDCTTCHQPHGSENFRLLVRAYPEGFYAAYAPERYALCFECHDQEMLASPKTTTDTGFRDGELNLHYRHVHNDPRGRTCRACHDVHASKQPHQLRDGVPFGPGGFVLSTHWVENKDGGQCSKTCHPTKVYKNGE
jgi:predicted CXXCH cytochrome family protein